MLGKTALYRMDKRGKQCGADFIKINVKNLYEFLFRFLWGQELRKEGL